MLWVEGLQHARHSAKPMSVIISFHPQSSLQKQVTISISQFIDFYLCPFKTEQFGAKFISLNQVILTLQSLKWKGKGKYIEIKKDFCTWEDPLGSCSTSIPPWRQKGQGALLLVCVWSPILLHHVALLPLDIDENPG